MDISSSSISLNSNNTINTSHSGGFFSHSFLLLFVFSSPKVVFSGGLPYAVSASGLLAKNIYTAGKAVGKMGLNGAALGAKSAMIAARAAMLPIKIAKKSIDAGFFLASLPGKIITAPLTLGMNYLIPAGLTYYGAKKLHDTKFAKNLTQNLATMTHKVFPKNREIDKKNIASRGSHDASF